MLTGTYNLLFCIFVGTQQIDGLHVSEVNVMAKQEDKEQLADIFLLAVAIESFVPFEFGANVGQLFIDPLDLGFLAFTWWVKD